jgi:exosome complex component RRP41
MELSKVIRESLEPVVLTDLYPRTTIDVFIEVLQSDGGSRCAGITAASLALADAGIPMKELVAACAVGKIQGKMALDLSDAEDKYGDADLPVALVPNMGLVTLLQMDGNLTTAEFEQGLSMAIEACKTIHTMQRETLKKKFATVKDAVEEREEPEIVA